ncbi:MAG: 50S ribosomal protein L11 methyltransferase [Clostridia bacterium]|jgi:ribosomal protein L11 methyltransferase|nr:50S ribosomal protein L11 methyltransferase [Clostridia bacterium]
MEWQEITVITVSEAVEAVAECFYQVGSGGVVIEDPELLKTKISEGNWDAFELPEERLYQSSPVVKGYLPINDSLPQKLEQLKLGIEEIMARLGEKNSEIRLAIVQEEDWANSWKVYFKPIKLGSRIVIKPTWEDYQAGEDEIVLEMDPGMAFGCGTHATTAMSALLLEKFLHPGFKVIDVGTGTGILAMIAASLGAEEVLALDYDEVAVKVAQENIQQNGLAHLITVKKNNLLVGVEQKVELIVANIVAATIIKLALQAKERLNQGGFFLVSGIIKERREEVFTALQEIGFVLREEKTQEDWVAQVWQLGV